VARHYDLSIIDAQSPIMIQRARRFGTRPLGNVIRPLVLPLDRREFARRRARSREHLDWRYADRRGGRFHLRVAEDADGSILGYAVGGARGDRGHLVDLLALPGRLDVAAALVREIGGVLAGAGCVDVLCWLPQRHPYRAVLRRAGYLDARARPFITYRPCGASAESLEFLAAPRTRVHFMLGDTDLV
jgi:hypothetical protein